MLKKFSLVSFLEKLNINKTSCYKLEDEEDKGQENYENPLKGNDKTLIVLCLSQHIS